MAVALHGEIKSAGTNLKDDTDSYQNSWKDAMVGLLASSDKLYRYIELVR